MGSDAFAGFLWLSLARSYCSYHSCGECARFVGFSESAADCFGDREICIANSQWMTYVADLNKLCFRSWFVSPFPEWVYLRKSFFLSLLGLRGT